MLNRFFSKKGKGAAQVSLTLDQPHIRSGETLTGQIHVKGGNNDQVIDKLQVHLLFYAKVGSEQASTVVQTIEVATAHPLTAKAELRLPFSYQMPELPQSSQYVRYRFQTVAEINGTTIHQNSGDFTVLPSETLRMAQNGWRALGFKDLPLSGRFNGAVQIFEYAVTKDALKKRISEPQAVFLPEQGGVRIHVAFLTPHFPHPQYATVHLTHDLLQSREQTQQVIADFLDKELQNGMPNNVPTLPVFEKQVGQTVSKVTGSPLIGDIAMKSLYPFGAITYSALILFGDPVAQAGRGLFESIPFDTGVSGSPYGAGGLDTGSLDAGGFDAGGLDSGGLGGGSFDGGSSNSF